MIVGGWICNACVGGSISDLASSGSPEGAMIDFCRSQLVHLPTPFGGGKPNTKYQVLMAHYQFCAGPEGERSAHKIWARYGTEFAQFILDNGFGKIATLPAVLNLRHHPDTTCQVWLWQPDQAAIEKWWEVTGKPLSDKMQAEKLVNAQKANQEWLKKQNELKPQKGVIQGGGGVCGANGGAGGQYILPNANKYIHYGGGGGGCAPEPKEVQYAVYNENRADGEDNDYQF